MKRTSLILLTVILGLGIFSFAYADIIQSPTPFFLDADANKASAPFYRFHGEDWSWTHGAIAGPFAIATLRINAWDVDTLGISKPEQDGIWGLNSSNNPTDWIKLGILVGDNNVYSDTFFSVPSSLFDEISGGGLQVRITIDENFPNPEEGWAVTLKESELTVSSAVPEPATMLLLGSGLIGLAGFARRRFHKK